MCGSEELGSIPVFGCIVLPAIRRIFSLVVATVASQGAYFVIKWSIIRIIAIPCTEAGSSDTRVHDMLLVKHSFRVCWSCRNLISHKRQADHEEDRSQDLKGRATPGACPKNCILSCESPKMPKAYTKLLFQFIIVLFLVSVRVFSIESSEFLSVDFTVAVVDVKLGGSNVILTC